MSTKENLVKALQDASAPREMIDKAKAGYYDDFETSITTPIGQLVLDARAAGLQNIAERAMNGEFDATLEEGEAWIKRSGIFDDLKGIDPFKESGGNE